MARSHIWVIHLSAILAVIWFISNCLYSYSLMWTNIASSTIISNLSSVFTLTFSYFCGLETLTPYKIVGILLCLAGVVLITLQDQSSGSEHAGFAVLGDIMALLSAFGYGVYTTYLRYYVPQEDTVSMELVLGYMGVTCALLCAPLLLLVIYARVDDVGNFSGIIFAYLLMTGKVKAQYPACV